MAVLAKRARRSKDRAPLEKCILASILSFAYIISIYSTKEQQAVAKTA
jgi:hypothetical protein